MSADTDDEFQKELITLFVQEAHEWLQQIHVSLDELQQGPPADRHLQLAHTMKVGLSNLGGSAATINLHEVEQTSFAALPLVEAVANPSVPLSAQAFLALCKQLGQIDGALTRATGVAFDAKASAEAAAAATLPARELMAALHALQARLTDTGAMSCQVTKMVLAQVDGMTRNGVTHCDVASLRELLKRGAQAEQAFAQAVHQLGPLVANDIRKLSQASAAEWGNSAGAWAPMVERTGELWSASQQVNAVEAMTFFTGLQSFLSIVLAQRVVPGSPQFEKVEARLREMPALIRDWAAVGRRERDAIEALLPVA